MDWKLLVALSDTGTAAIIRGQWGEVPSEALSSLSFEELEQVRRKSPDGSDTQNKAITNMLDLATTPDQFHELFYFIPSDNSVRRKAVEKGVELVRNADDQDIVEHLLALVLDPENPLDQNIQDQLIDIAADEESALEVLLEAVDRNSDFEDRVLRKILSVIDQLDSSSCLVFRACVGKENERTLVDQALERIKDYREFVRMIGEPFSSHAQFLFLHQMAKLIVSFDVLLGYKGMFSKNRAAFTSWDSRLIELAGDDFDLLLQVVKEVSPLHPDYDMVVRTLWTRSNTGDYWLKIWLHTRNNHTLNKRAWLQVARRLDEYDYQQLLSIINKSLGTELHYVSLITKLVKKGTLSELVGTYDQATPGSKLKAAVRKKISRSKEINDWLLIFEKTNDSRLRAKALAKLVEFDRHH